MHITSKIVVNEVILIMIEARIAIELLVALLLRLELRAIMNITKIRSVLLHKSPAENVIWIKILGLLVVLMEWLHLKLREFMVGSEAWWWSLVGKLWPIRKLCWAI